jgi:hypothetical protein
MYAQALVAKVVQPITHGEAIETATNCAWREIDGIPRTSAHAR